MTKNLIITFFAISTIALSIFIYYQSKRVTRAETLIQEISEKLKEQELTTELEKKMAIQQTEKLQECEKMYRELELKSKN